MSKRLEVNYAGVHFKNPVALASGTCGFGKEMSAVSYTHLDVYKRQVLGAVKNQELLDTLVMYYECGANMERVSDRMYTHKNTVKYRLNRLQELTGLDLRNPDDNFRLYLAVLALKMNFKISF